MPMKGSPPGEEKPKPVARTKKTDATKEAPKTQEVKKPRPRSPRNGVELPEGRKFTTGEVAREAGRKGGLKAAETKRLRKTLREELLDLLQVKSKDSEGKEHTQQELISASMIKEARGGNVRAFETIRDTIGEKQREQVEMSVALPQFENLDAAFANMSGEAP